MRDADTEAPAIRVTGSDAIFEALGARSTAAAMGEGREEADDAAGLRPFSEERVDAIMLRLDGYVANRYEYERLG